MDAVGEEERVKSAKLLRRECDNLLNEIERLNTELGTQEQRLKNVMDLVSRITFVLRIYFFILAIGIQ